MKSKFAEIKIEMVMKLKKLTRQAAIREIARINESKRRVHSPKPRNPHDNIDMMAAEEFFN